MEIDWFHAAQANLTMESVAVARFFERLWQAAGEKRAALLAEARAMASQDAEAAGHLAYFCLHNGMPAQSLELYQLLVRRDPGDIEARKGLAFALAACGHVDQARRRLRELLRQHAHGDMLDVEIRLGELGGLTAWMDWTPARAAEVLGWMVRHPRQLVRALREWRELLRDRRFIIDARPLDWYLYLRFFGAQGYRWPRLDCDVCGSTEGRTFYLNRQHRIVACCECGLERVLRIAPGGYDVSASMYDTAPCFRSLTAFSAADEWRQQRNATLDTLVPPADGYGRMPRVFEIGAADGGMLQLLAERGWNIDGLEVGRPFIESARERYGIVLRQGTINDIWNMPRGEYDLVLAFHVIEHLDRPSVLSDAARWLLRPHGLFLLETPVTPLRAADYAVRRNPHYGYMLPQHMYFFTEPTLRRYLEKNGWRIEGMHRTEIGAGLAHLACAVRSTETGG